MARGLHLDEIEWTGAGIVIGGMQGGGGPRVQPVRRDEVAPADDPFERVFQPTALTMRWRELVRFEAVAPWPAFRLRWRYAADGTEEETFVPHGGVAPEAFEEVVVALAAHVERHRGIGPNGWLLEPVHVWEPAAALPEETAAPKGGAYRTATRPTGERVVARWRAKPTFVHVLQWLAYGTAHWRAILTEIVVTEEHLYARRKTGRPERIARALLTGVGVDPREAAVRVYRYGRRIRVALPTETEVAQALDADARRRAGVTAGHV